MNKVLDRINGIEEVVGTRAMSVLDGSLTGYKVLCFKEIEEVDGKEVMDGVLVRMSPQGYLVRTHTAEGNDQLGWDLISTKKHVYTSVPQEMRWAVIDEKGTYDIVDKVLESEAITSK